jgi:hypothetical protein
LLKLCGFKKKRTFEYGTGVILFIIT